MHTPERENLIAARETIDEIRDMIGADSLCYLSLDGLLDAVGAKTYTVLVALMGIILLNFKNLAKGLSLCQFK